jgi:hypothetical protein
MFSSKSFVVARPQKYWATLLSRVKYGFFFFAQNGRSESRWCDIHPGTQQMETCWLYIFYSFFLWNTAVLLIEHILGRCPVF